MRRTFTIELTVDSSPDVPDTDIWRDLTRILSVVKEDQPYRDPAGADWWTNRADAAKCVGVRGETPKGLVAL